jgi:hypothetical protein
MKIRMLRNIFMIFFLNALPLSDSWESKLAKYIIFDIMLIKRMRDASSTWL